MEKQLLLLGVLRDHEVHGYQLNEILGSSAGLPIRLRESLGKCPALNGWTGCYSSRISLTFSMPILSMNFAMRSRFFPSLR